MLASPIAGAVPLCAARAGSAAGLRGQGLREKLPLRNLPAHAAAVQRRGATTRAARSCQGATCDAKLTLPGVRKAWGLGLEHTNCWLTM